MRAITSSVMTANGQEETAAGDMTPEQAAAVTAYVRQLPQVAQRISGGMVAVSVEVVEYNKKRITMNYIHDNDNYRHQGLFNASRDVNLLSYTLVALMASHYGTMPGVKLPSCGPSAEANPKRNLEGADCFREYGYGDHDVQSWLEDFATGRVWSGDDGRFLGLNATVYGFGTPTRTALPAPAC
ncbi:hypothetical protein HXX76_010967 [Chlamydomonas incerta]|uniref:Uncharacterized protein n=1 Tax=Chlamydomonas incerta TaxID=51695 RepID=A0A835SIV2_CHLIN|nr:hypothetical protein HXX76_010967 [Chlamydomonas incerta]|eukprot:KAG2423199.1 hypothetical protein HXX76_010967 [Chlamydomonas incerta]